MLGLYFCTKNTYCKIVVFSIPLFFFKEFGKFSCSKNQMSGGSLLKRSSEILMMEHQNLFWQSMCNALCYFAYWQQIIGNDIFLQILLVSQFLMPKLRIFVFNYLFALENIIPMHNLLCYLTDGEVVRVIYIHICDFVCVCVLNFLYGFYLEVFLTAFINFLS